MDLREQLSLERLIANTVSTIASDAGNSALQYAANRKWNDCTNRLEILQDRAPQDTEPFMRPGKESDEG